MPQNLTKRIFNLYRDFSFDEVLEMSANVMGTFTSEINEKEGDEVMNMEVVLEEFVRIFQEAYYFNKKRKKK
jgi:hypothetical protein